MNKLLILPLLAAALGGAALPETRLTVTLPADLAPDAHGRLLVFAEPATAANASADEVGSDASNRNGVAVAARVVAGFGPGRSVTIDLSELAYPQDFAATVKGDYRVQVVLDCNGDYAYSGRGPGDLVSKVVTVRMPLEWTPAISLTRAIPPAPDQFDTAGLSPAGAAMIAVSRPHLHDERIVSPALTRFHGLSQAVSAWVLTPPGYDPTGRRTYPTVYTANGFGSTHRDDGQILARIWQLMETGAIPPMFWVSLDYATVTGTTEFADSLNNGPWGQALTADVIPALEARYRMDARPSGRFLTGHSSGGWFALWTMVRYPAMFGGSWATAPDPVDFGAFLGVDIYAPGANLYRDSAGATRVMERDHDKVLTLTEREARMEAVLGPDGGQLRSFEWVFSPRGTDGKPLSLFDRETGAVDPAVAAYWRGNYDIGQRIRSAWPRLKRDLDGKVHVRVGTADSFYLDGPVHRLESAFREVGGRAEFKFVPGATHSQRDLYTQGGDRAAFWKEMTAAMYRIARPGRVGRDHRADRKVRL